jgi:hypothetical protein
MKDKLRLGSRVDYFLEHLQAYINGRKIIVGIDSWRGGIAYFLSLHEEFERAGYKLILIHFGSWSHDKECPLSENVKGMDVYDISFFSDLTLYQVLLRLRPAAVVFFSIIALSHQAVNRMAKYLNILTIHSYHGIVSAQAVEASMLYKPSIQALASKSIQVFLANALKVFPFYLSTIYCTKGSLFDYFIPFRAIWDRAFYVTRTPKADQITDLGFVYIERDRHHMHECYSLPINRIKAVGNFDIASSDLVADDFGSYSHKHTYQYGRNIVYIDTALLLGGLLFKDIPQYLDHLLFTRDELNKHGLNLSLKLHPAWKNTILPDMLSQHGLITINKAHIKDALMNSYAVITEPSTFALIPALLGCRLLFAKYSAVRSLEYGQLLKTYPRSATCAKLSTIENQLSSMDMTNNSLSNWIAENKGPQPASHFAKRIVNTSLDYISASQVWPT